MRRGRTGLLGSIAATAIAVVSLVLAGCGGGGNGSSSSAGSSEDAAKPGGVVRVAAVEEATTLDPFEAIGNTDVQVVGQIDEGLYKQDESGKFLPWLATGYKRSADGLTWTFQLRKGVTFSNGRPLTPGDVVFSIETARTSAYSEGLLEPVDHAAVAGSGEVEVVTKKPMPALIAVLASHYVPVVQKNYGGVSAKEFAQHPIGTGPFVLKDWAHGNAITLAKNPKYWKSGLPVADEIIFSIIPDDNSRISEFRGGEADIVAQPAWSQVASLEASPEFTVKNYGNFALDNVMLNIKSPQFEDPRVREAMDLAIDRNGIIQTALAGQGEPAGSFLPPTVPYYEDIKAPEQDVAKAKSLLKEAVAAGADPSFTLETIAGEAYAEGAAQIIQQNLASVGFKVRLQPLDPAAIGENVATSTFQAILSYYFTGVADPAELASFYPEAIAKPGGVETKPLEALAQEAATEFNAKKREELYFRLQNDVAEEMQIIPVDYHAAVWATNSNLVGLEVNSTNDPLLLKAGFAE